MADYPTDKLPPQNLEAEMAVLGSMLIDEDAIAAAIEFLDKKSFYQDSHQKGVAAALTNCISRITTVQAIQSLSDCQEGR